MTERLARGSSRRLWLVVGLWLIVVFSAFVLVAMFLAFEGEAEITRTTESKCRQDPRPGLPARRRTGRQLGIEVRCRRAEDGQAREAADAYASRCACGRARFAGVRHASSPTARTGASSRRTGTPTVLLVGLGRE